MSYETRSEVEVSESERSIAELFRQLSRDIGTLLRQEGELARTGQLQRIEDCGERPGADGQLDQRRMQRMPEGAAMQEILRLAPAITRRLEERANPLLQRRGDGIE